jgi:hypothetical protein
MIMVPLSDPYIISEKVIGAKKKNDYKYKFNSPSNVEIPINNPAYIVWQDKIS